MMTVNGIARLLASAITSVLLMSCGEPQDDTDGVEQWDGSNQATTIQSIYGDTHCPRELMETSLRHRGLPSAIVETAGGNIRVFVGNNPSRSPESLGATRTGYSLRGWELWKWSPRVDSPEYGYILLPNDGSDAAYYQSAATERCDVGRLAEDLRN
jgi:hypothetical protein